MRTSHTKIRQRIAEEKSKLTDAELFGSTAYAAYLTDIAETAADRYKKKLRVVTEWNEDENAHIAYTNNKVIHINCGNYLSRSFPTRLLKAMSIMGLNAHELGHVLYMDFSTLNLYAQSLENGILYPKTPDDLSEEDAENLENLLEKLSEKNPFANKVIGYIAHSIANVLEDVYVEERICSDFPGDFKRGIRLNNVRLAEDTPSISKQIEQSNIEASIVLNTMIQYCKTNTINNLDGYSGEYLDCFYEFIPIIDEVIDKKDAKVRFDATNRILIKMWKYVERMIEQLEKDKSLTPEQLQELLNKLLGDMFERHDSERKAAIEADKTGDSFIYEMFCAELCANEYAYTGDLEQILDYFGFTAVMRKKFVEYYLHNFLRITSRGKKVSQMA